MDLAANELNNILKGIVPLGDFWMMGRLKSDMSSEDLVSTPSKKEILKAGLTIKRFETLTEI